jgi:hypothetical protein
VAKDFVYSSTATMYAGQKPSDEFSGKEARARFEAALKSAMNTSPKPLKDKPKVGAKKKKVGAKIKRAGKTPPKRGWSGLFFKFFDFFGMSF